MKVGVYCGSFNPVHNGHLKIMQAVLDHNLADQVLVIATGNYWNKTDLPDVEKRIALLKKFETDRIFIDEKHNAMPYTYQIFRALKKEHPENSYALILGSDNLLKFDEWKRYRELLKNEFIIIPRKEDNIEELLAHLGKENSPVLEVEGIEDISSTFIRENIDDCERIREMVPDSIICEMKELYLSNQNS